MRNQKNALSAGKPTNSMKDEFENHSNTFRYEKGIYELVSNASCVP